MYKFKATMKASEKEILWSILDDYYSDDENVDTVEISRTLVETIAKMIDYDHCGHPGL